MAFIPTARCVEVAFKYVSGAPNVVNVYHVQTPAAPTDVDLQTICSEFASWWDTYLYLLLSTQVAITSITATDVSQDGGHQYTTSSFTHSGGADTAALYPTNISVIATWRTPSVGRSYRGRTYFSGIPEDKFISDVLDSTYRGNVETACENLLANLATAYYPLAIRSLYHNKAPRSAGVLTLINSVVVRPYVGTQRRRIQL